MPEYRSPGVYIEEISGGAKPIESVSTSTACFIGITERAQRIKEIVDNQPVWETVYNQPIKITSWEEYSAIFGDFVQGVYTPLSIYSFFQNGGKRCYVVSVKTMPKASKAVLSQTTPKQTQQNQQQNQNINAQSGQAQQPQTPNAQLQTQQQVQSQANQPNQEPPVYLLVRAKQPGESGQQLQVKLETDPPAQGAAASEQIPLRLVVKRQDQRGEWKEQERREATLLKQENRWVIAYQNNIAPRLVELVLTDAAQAATLEQIRPASSQDLTLALEQTALAPPAYKLYQGDPLEGTGVAGLGQYEDVNMICMPDLMLAWDKKIKANGGEKEVELDGKDYVKSVQRLAIDHCDLLKNRMVILDAPPNMNPQQVLAWRLNTAGYDSSRAVLYYPWVEMMDPATNRKVQVPPSGHIAGIWARNDTERGVHKAPANEVVRGAIGLTYRVTQGHQDDLNPEGVNCLRFFPGMDNRVWGARTMSKSDPEWKYVNIRRLFHMVEQSIQRSTMWAVFEPNDHRLWTKLRRDVNNFLMTIYSQGMLFGATPAQAFFVKCDEENNPKYTRDLGQVIIDIGIAPVKPAEFVIFRIRQWAPEDAQT